MAEAFARDSYYFAASGRARHSVRADCE